MSQKYDSRTNTNIFNFTFECSIIFTEWRGASVQPKDYFETHFTYEDDFKLYKYNSCSGREPGKDERNYLSHAGSHFTRYHANEKAEFDKCEAKKQIKIGPSFTNISESDRQLQKLVVSSALTLPVNFFRNAKSKSFTNELRSIKAVTSYDIIQRHMTNLAAEKMRVVQSAILRNSARPLDKPTRQNRIGCGRILDNFEMDFDSNSASHRF